MTPQVSLDLNILENEKDPSLKSKFPKSQKSRYEYIFSNNFRVFWILVFFVLIYAYVHLTVQIWDKWNESPVIVSFDDKSTPVWKIPFPAITICSEVKASKTRFNFSRVFNKFRRMRRLQDDE